MHGNCDTTVGLCWLTHPLVWPKAFTEQTAFRKRNACTPHSEAHFVQLPLYRRPPARPCQGLGGVAMDPMEPRSSSQTRRGSLSPNCSKRHQDQRSWGPVSVQKDGASEVTRHPTAWESAGPEPLTSWASAPGPLGTCARGAVSAVYKPVGHRTDTSGGSPRCL